MYLNWPKTAQVSVHLPHSGTAGRHLCIGPDVVNHGVPLIEHLLVLRVHVEWALLDDSSTAGRLCLKIQKLFMLVNTCQPTYSFSHLAWHWKTSITIPLA